MTELSERVARLEADVRQIKEHVFATVSKNLIGDFMKQHPEIKTASHAVSLMLEHGIGSKEALEHYKNFDFGTNTGHGQAPKGKEHGEDSH